MFLEPGCSLHSLRQEDNVDIAEIWIRCSQDSGDYKFNTAQSHVPRLLCHCSTQQKYFSHCWGSTKMLIMKNLLPHITGLCLQNNNSLFFPVFSWETVVFSIILVQLDVVRYFTLVNTLNVVFRMLTTVQTSSAESVRDDDDDDSEVVEKDNIRTNKATNCEVRR